MSAHGPFPLPVDDLVPHRPPMRLVDTLLSSGEAQGCAEASLPQGHLLLDGEGRLEPAGFVELLAQAYAAFKGYGAVVAGDPVRVGFLVAVSRMNLHGTARVGDRLTVRFRETGVVGSFFLAEGDISRGETLLASGALRLWCPE